MRPLLFVAAAAALVFAATIGTASADDQTDILGGVSDIRFDILAGVPAESLDQDVLAATAGRSILLSIRDALGRLHFDGFLFIAGVQGGITIDATQGTADVNITVFLAP